ncbi:cache domain-containing protein [Thiosulfativibrio zosterae]|uniref:Chemotaxis protein CheW n=1 Tax=Thiosulfativibrio zosterae TaxID=2675053 RepID=A0A6F8PPI0_9GAMM|nr:cache domain-containing protein [Thiosulfativibrio zosterae]BBP44023.1 hypothetical protein THMIRHAT_17690 [Thiosulfativibrio zosterae]
MFSSTGSKSNQQFAQYLPEVKKYLAELQHQDLWWTTVAMVGKINNENIDPQLLVSIVETQKEFQDLRDIMINELIGRYINQANSEVMLKAQAAIDILIRNLFERTADVGFLATDDDLVEFMASAEKTPEQKAFIHRRLQEYVAKYSVYDDVVLLTPSGEVAVKLDEANHSSQCHDPLIHETINSQADYVEIYRACELFPQKSAAHVFAKKMQANIGGQLRTVGLLCLSFNFEDEMKRIYQVLNQNQPDYVIMLLDKMGKSFSCNMPEKFSAGLQIQNPDSYQEPRMEGPCLQFATKTQGYQGYCGLPWYGLVRAPNQVVFSDKDYLDAIDLTIERESPLYLSELEETNLKVSTLLLIVILNGKILSLKRDVKSFLPVLDSFQNISIDIQEIFTRFIHHIHNILVKTIQDKIASSASLSIEVMDRNLYERANDCRWWALNSTFRKVLSKAVDGNKVSGEDTHELSRILAYINQLYTVYTNIILYDTHGKILAVSDKSQTKLIGTTMPNMSEVSQCLKLQDTQAYFVSEFKATPLYDDKHTYIYHAAVKDWQVSHKNVGGIALIFDSEPQFAAMLQETQPVYRTQAVNESTFSAFVDRQGHIISTTHASLKVGAQLSLPAKLLSAENGQINTVLWKGLQSTYLIGYKVSQGYREYKNGDGYTNDVIALVFTGV